MFIATDILYDFWFNLLGIRSSIMLRVTYNNTIYTTKIKLLATGMQTCSSLDAQWYINLYRKVMKIWYSNYESKKLIIINNLTDIIIFHK